MNAGRITATGIALGLAAVGGVGTLVAIARASGSDWTALTVSQLSADPTAGPWFRGTMLACGALALWLAARMWHILARLRAAGLTGPRWVGLYRVAFLAIGLGFIGTGAFPLGVAPLVELAHGTSAYAIPIAMLVLMLTCRLAVPALGDRFGRSGLAALAVILVVYTVAVLGHIAYAPMELIGFGIGGAWLVLLVYRLEGLAGAVAAPPSDPAGT